MQQSVPPAYSGVSGGTTGGSEQIGGLLSVGNSSSLGPWLLLWTQRPFASPPWESSPEALGRRPALPRETGSTEPTTLRLPHPRPLLGKTRAGLQKFSAQPGRLSLSH